VNEKLQQIFIELTLKAEQVSGIEWGLLDQNNDVLLYRDKGMKLLVNVARE
jgi:myosin heavy subunit